MLVEEIQWIEVPEELKEVAIIHLRDWWPLLPTWVQEFHVRFNPIKDSTLEVNLNYRNRWVVFTLTGRWLDCPEEERANGLRHEFVHINLEPLVVVCNRIIEDLAEDKSVRREFLDSMYTDGMEAAVEDMARAIGRLEKAL